MTVAIEKQNQEKQRVMRCLWLGFYVFCYRMSKVHENNIKWLKPKKKEEKFIDEREVKKI